MRVWTMVKPSISLSAVLVLLLGLTLRVSALPIADADADAAPAPSPAADAEPSADPDIIPGRVQNNPVLLVYDLLANLVASIPIIGVALVEILGLGRR